MLGPMTLASAFAAALDELRSARNLVTSLEVEIFELERIIQDTRADHLDDEDYRACKNETAREDYLRTLVPETYQALSERKLELIHQKNRLAKANLEWDMCRYRLRLVEVTQQRYEAAA